MVTGWSGARVVLFRLGSLSPVAEPVLCRPPGSALEEHHNPAGQSTTRIGKANLRQGVGIERIVQAGE